MNIQFAEIVSFIQQARTNAIKAVNTELIDLYWKIGEYISIKIDASEWGDSVVSELANFIAGHHPELKGFSDKNLWRMKQFYQIYKDFPNLSTLSRELSWSHNLAIVSRCKTNEEREFYLNLSKNEHYSYRELNRQISSSVFERVMTNTLQLSTALRENETEIINTFKENYIVEFLNLSESHSEKDLQKGIVKQMKEFILELGKDFLFIGEEYKLEVGNSDYYIDLLFFHRELQCLVAFELKADTFKPEHLGKLNFYLEALDRNVKKQHEYLALVFYFAKTKMWKL